jgi:hypothetical protein
LWWDIVFHDSKAIISTQLRKRFLRLYWNLTISRGSRSVLNFQQDASEKLAHDQVSEGFHFAVRIISGALHEEF